MAEMGKGDHLPAAEETTLPAALFKNSLRLWQARWKAQQADAQQSEVPAAPDAPSRLRSRAKKGRKAPPSA
jgi:hypothetical protein